MRRLLPAALAALALAAGGCGGEDESGRLIPAGDAESLSATLERIEQARSEGNCIEARSLTQEARRQANELPGSVDAELRRRIRRGISRIFELLPTQCDEPQDEEPAVTTQEPEEPEAPVETQETPAPTTDEPAGTSPAPTPTTPVPTPTTPAPADPQGSEDDGTGGAAAEEEL